MRGHGAMCQVGKMGYSMKHQYNLKTSTDNRLLRFNSMENLYSCISWIYD